MGYNQDLFDAAGLPYPSADWGWEDLERAAAALTQGEGPNKTYGVYADSWWGVWLPYVWQNGGDLISEDGSACTLAQPPAVEALEWWASLNRQGFSPNPEQLSGLGMTGWATIPSRPRTGRFWGRCGAGTLRSSFPTITTRFIPTASASTSLTPAPVHQTL